MKIVGLRELRQEASDLVRRVEEGEQVAITVAGRPAAKLVSAAPHTWRRWKDVASLFDGRDDPAWDADRDLVSHEIRDPWETDDTR